MDTNYQRLAARYIRRQAKQLSGQLDGVRAAEDIEFVHRARVATRRLRAAFRMFGPCFTPKRIGRWCKAIRRITASLGEARDRDVQIDWLRGALAAQGEKECSSGIARVLVELERDRERLQRRVVEAVDRLDAGGVLRDMRRVTKKILEKSETATNASAASPKTQADIERHVVRQLNRLLEHQNSLADPEDREHHHAMRIAAKRLRYVLEISRPACPGRFDEALDAIKRVQTLLGDVHDCDVWLAHLEAFAAGERDRVIAMFGHAGRFLHLQPGIEHLQNDRREHRQAVFAELVKDWNELSHRGVWSTG